MFKFFFQGQKMDQSDFLSNPPKFMEQLTDWEFSDRFYAFLPILPIFFSTFVTFYIIYTTAQNYLLDKAGTFTPEAKNQLFICWSLSILCSEFILRSNGYFLTGRAFKLFASNKIGFKDIALSGDWRNNLVSLLIVLGSILNPALLFMASFLLLSINIHRLFSKRREKSKKQDAELSI
jgi:hypothetical protein